MDIRQYLVATQHANRLCSHHAFQNHSKEIWQLGIQLDHLGIVLVMWSSMVPSNYFGFYCSPQLLYTYNTIVHT